MSSVAMPRPYKHPKTGVYWIRQAVPQALRPLTDKRELKRSLKTKDAGEAKRRALAVLAEFHHVLDQARQGLRCTANDLKALRAAYFEQQRAAWLEQARREGWDDSGFEDLTIAHGEIPDQQPPGYRPPPDVHEWDRDPAQDAAVLVWGMPRVDKLLNAHAFPIRGELRERLAFDLYNAEREAIDAAGWEYAGHARSAPKTPTLRPPEARSWDRLFEAYADAREPAPSTRKDWGRMFAHFGEFMDGKQPYETSRKDVRDYRDHLKAGGGLSKRPPSAHRINEGYLAAIRAVFRWAVEEDLLPENPAYGVRVSNRSGATRAVIRGYTNEEVAVILQAARGATKAHIRWVPWLCAFTGARVSEILNAHRAHVGQTEGIWYLSIRPDTRVDEDGSEHSSRTKTASSQRCVPLHPALLAEGFLDYLDQVPEGDFLFPGKWRDQHGNRTKAPANKLRDWIRTVVTITEDLSPLHSFRHWLVSQARSVSMDPDIQKQLTGHQFNDVHGRYGPSDVKTLSKALAAIPSPT